MTKDEILKRSREENNGRADEREIRAYGTASRVGILAGAVVCILLVFAGELLLHMPEIGFVGWIVYFAMQGSGSIALYRDLKSPRNLFWGLVEIVIALVFAVALIVKSRVQ